MADNHDPDDQAEARALIASAREYLVELLDEGIDTLDVPAPAASAPTPAAAPQMHEQMREQKPRGASAGSAPPSPAQPSRQAPERTNLSLARQAPTWGPNPTLIDVQEQLGDCQRCGLCAGRKTIVFGSGNPNADLMFIGEGPSEQEDRDGVPFVGKAGELLTQMLEKGIETPRDDVYICNIVKCRPPQNRNPLPDEVATCRPFLDGQIDAVKPKVIVTLGKPATSLLLGRDVAITRVRGTWQDYRGIPLMPTLHPAYILREYTPENRRWVWEDLKAAIGRVHELSR
ncbi:MAG: uracil-DNA glycosylase family 4 [Myxococcota bacterium]|jgi:uracil-DNA glycosylase family 4